MFFMVALKISQGTKRFMNYFSALKKKKVLVSTVKTIYCSAEVRNVDYFCLLRFLLKCDFV